MKKYYAKFEDGNIVALWLSNNTEEGHADVFELSQLEYEYPCFVSLVNGVVVFDQSSYDDLMKKRHIKEEAYQWVKDHKPGIMSLPALNEFVKKLAESMGYE